MTRPSVGISWGGEHVPAGCLGPDDISGRCYDLPIRPGDALARVILDGQRMRWFGSSWPGMMADRISGNVGDLLEDTALTGPKPALTRQ